MNFALSVIQKLLKTEARNFLGTECPASSIRRMETDELGYDPALWGKMVGFGWTSLPFSAEYGGADGSFLDLVVLAEEMGRVNLPSPFIPSLVLGGLTLMDSKNEEKKRDLLPKIASGETIATMASLEEDDNPDCYTTETRAILKNNAYHIKGVKLFVPFAPAADVIIVALGIDNPTGTVRKPALFVLNGIETGILMHLMPNIAGQKLYELDFDLIVSPESLLAEGDEAVKVIKKTNEKAAIIKCAELVGAMGKVLEMTLNYARERKQFGHPIGSFQTIQNYCANMAVDVEASRWNTYHAAWLLSEGLPATMPVAIAKTWIEEACERVLSLSHQIHGAIGFTRELDLELFIRCAKMAEVAFGSGDFYRQKIAQCIIEPNR